MSLPQIRSNATFLVAILAQCAYHFVSPVFVNMVVLSAAVCTKGGKGTGLVLSGLVGRSLIFSFLYFLCSSDCPTVCGCQQDTHRGEINYVSHCKSNFNLSFYVCSGHVGGVSEADGK